MQSQRISLEHQHGRRFFVLEHQHGCCDVMWKRSIFSAIFQLGGKGGGGWEDVPNANILSFGVQSTDSNLMDPTSCAIILNAHKKNFNSRARILRS